MPEKRTLVDVLERVAANAGAHQSGVAFTHEMDQKALYPERTDTMTHHNLGSNATADELEQAALNLAVRAQAIRQLDNLEPQGDEPVISWKHSYPYRSVAEDTPSPREYTFVAFKADNGLWYSTERHDDGLTWRELGTKYPAIAEGKFWLAGLWEWRGQPTTPTTNGNSQPAEIRAWAKANGYDVGSHGSIKQHIQDAYYQATNGNGI